MVLCHEIGYGYVKSIFLNNIWLYWFAVATMHIKLLLRSVVFIGLRQTMASRLG